MEITTRGDGYKTLKASEGKMIVFDADNGIYSQEVWLSKELSAMTDAEIIALYGEVTEAEAEEALASKEAEAKKANDISIEKAEATDNGD